MSDEKILENQQKIIKVEQHQDKLSDEKRALEEKLFHLQEELRKGFRQLTELNYEGVQQGYNAARWIQANNENKQQTFQRQLSQANEEIAYSYKKEIQHLEMEREELYVERRKLSWD